MRYKSYTINGPDLKEMRDEFHTLISPRISGFIDKFYNKKRPNNRFLIYVQKGWHHMPFVLYQSYESGTPTELIVAEMYFAMQLHHELYVTEVHDVRLEFNFGECILDYFPNKMVAEFRIKEED